MADEARPLTVLWFAWLRERTGVGEERIAPPPEIATVGALIDWLCAGARATRRHSRTAARYAAR